MNEQELKFVYNQLDNLVKDDKSCCSKGCSACCFQQIEVLNFEKNSIKSFLQSMDLEYKEQIKVELTKWLDIFDSNTPNRVLTGHDVFGNFGQTITKGLKCPLLIDNLCSIYEMRPVTCRTHFVENQPKLCEVNRLRDPALKGLAVRSKFVQMVKSNREVTIEPIAYVIAEVLLPSRKLKNIEKIIL